MKKIFLNPLFLLGLAIRLSLVAIVTPTPVIDWYEPFLAVTSSSFNLDPWMTWLNQDGTVVAFPYGYVMWLFFLPLTVVCKVTAIPVSIGYGVTLMGLDIALLLLLRKVHSNRDRLLLFVYWLSPIVIAATYLLGFNDLVPVWLLAVSLYCVKKLRLLLAGFICIAAISAKLSMVLSLPFFAIYLLHNRALRRFLPLFVRGLLLGTVILLLPFILFSPSGVSMLLNNPEMSKVYWLAISFGSTTMIYLVPLVYLLMLYAAWRIKRLNFELFTALLGMSFLLVVLMTPASPGWFIWAMPLLVSYQMNSDRIGIFLAALFSALYVIGSLSFSVQVGALLQLFSSWNMLGSFQPEKILASLIHTSMIATGIVLAVRIWRDTVSRNDYFRLSRKPFVLGISGDSGAGKDTFADAIKGLFGADSVTMLSGDDYHLWDRQKPMWQVMTHLNPMANDLEGFANDLVSLADGGAIQSRHYDHQTGRMSRPFQINSNDIVIASGLHALYLPMLRDCYSLSIFLDIDEGLRRYFKLQRDVHQRGYTMERVLSSFERREPDSERFIRPQARYADLVMSLQPIHPRFLDDVESNSTLRFKLVIRSRHGLNEMSLTRVLIGVCGLHVDMLSNSDAAEIQLTIEGENSAEDIALAAKMICPRILEFLDIYPQWQDGVMGVMQLVTLSHINQALTKRLIW